LEQSISEAITETEVLSDEVRTDIRVKRAVPLYQTLEKVKASQPQLGHHTEDGSITATYTVQVQFPSTPLEDVLVYANDIGLSNMIKEIIKNAREAIEQAGSGEIDINVEISDEAACVHIHNTGSYIEEESQILHEPVNSNKADGKGMDLFMNRLLAEKWDGSLRLTGNYRAATEEHKEGVTFTITMQRVPVSDR
jgi:C4-dicarboxylate-specific signal transduction histidine kinase